jgi:hypothetical protein
MPICATLLQCFNETTSYWLLRYLVFRCRYIQLDLALYQRFLGYLDREFGVMLPELKSHLESSGF